jgi:hypothetical protein
MKDRLNSTLDQISEYLAHRKGLLPFLGLLLIILNFLLQFLPISGWIGESNFLLHLGLVIAILGFLIAWAL